MTRDCHHVPGSNGRCEHCFETVVGPFAEHPLPGSTDDATVRRSTLSPEERARQRARFEEYWADPNKQKKA
jgi:hypothetical protein